MDEVPEKRCAFCGAVLDGVPAAACGEHQCRRCGATGRYDAGGLVAIYIPNFYARISELESLNKEIIEEIGLEGMKGEYRDMRYLQRKHLQRQDVLTEVAFLSHFRPFVEKW